MALGINDVMTGVGCLSLLIGPLGERRRREEGGGRKGKSGFGLLSVLTSRYFLI